jgi:polygalacturonase
LFVLLLAAGLAGCAAGGREPGYKFFEWELNVGAHTAPDADTVFRVNDYGAVGDNIRMNTESIQQAIDAAAAAGGGTVTFGTGIYRTGSIYLKSNVRLDIPKGTILQASQDIADYPRIDTRVAGMEMVWPSALINAIDQQNVALSGEGTIDGMGKPFWDMYWDMRRNEYEPKGLRWIVDYDAERPRGILVQNCRNVTLSDFVMFRTGFWAIQILYSQYVTLDGITIDNNVDGHGPSTDGIDIDSSSDILVQNCDISCNDDNFCLKAGRDADGLRVNRPTERVVLRGNIARRGAGLVTCGSETSGGIRDIVGYDLTAIGTSGGARFKSAYTRGGTVENIRLSGLKLVDVGTPIVVDLNWNPTYSYSELPEGYNYDEVPSHWRTMLEQVDPVRGLPTIRDVYISEMQAVGSRTGISVGASERSTVEGFHLSNIRIEARRAGSISHAKNWTVDNVVIEAADGEPVRIENSEGVEL